MCLDHWDGEYGNLLFSMDCLGWIAVSDTWFVLIYSIFNLFTFYRHYAGAFNIGYISGPGEGLIWTALSILFVGY